MQPRQGIKAWQAYGLDNRKPQALGIFIIIHVLKRERERGRYYNVQSISIAHFGSWKVPKFGSPANLLVKLPWKQRVDLAQEMSILHPEAEVLVPGTPLRSSLRSSLGRSSHRDSAPGGWSWGRMKESLKNGIHLSSGGGFRNHPGLEVWNYLEIWSFQESWGCKAADFKNHLRIWAGQGLICKWWRDLTERGFKNGKVSLKPGWKQHVMGNQTTNRGIPGLPF